MYTADGWPIAAKISCGPYTEDGQLAAEAPASVWREQLAQVAELGYRYIDPMDDWVPIGDISDERFAELKEVLDDLDLRIIAISIGRNSVIDTERGDENLAMVHRTIDRGAELGAKFVNVGFLQELYPAQKEALWFWLADGHDDDPALYDKAVERVRELGEHAQSLGMQISLEMYEDTFLGTPEGAVQFLKDVDHAAVGINPDVGNLIRLHRPMPTLSSRSAPSSWTSRIRRPWPLPSPRSPRRCRRSSAWPTWPASPARSRWRSSTPSCSTRSSASTAAAPCS